MKSEALLAKRRYEKWKVAGEGRAYLAILFSMCEGVCPLCNKSMFLSFGNRADLPTKDRATFDHIVPIRLIKRHEKTNLAICCLECNSRGGSEKKHLWNVTTRQVGIHSAAKSHKPFVEQKRITKNIN